MGTGVWHPVARPSARCLSRVNPGPVASSLSLVLLYARQSYLSLLPSRVTKSQETMRAQSEPKQLLEAPPHDLPFWGVEGGRRTSFL